MNRPDSPVASLPGAAPTSGWRRRVLVHAGGLALIAIGALLGLLGLIKIQGVTFPLNIETREGCLADPSLVPPRASCPHEAEAILRHPNGRTEVIQGTPEQVQRRVAQATDSVITAERWRGLGYLLVALPLVEAGIAVIAWQVLHRGRWRSGRVVRSGGEPTSSPPAEAPQARLAWPRRRRIRAAGRRLCASWLRSCALLSSPLEVHLCC